jgi:hypothetical protein
VGVVILSKFFNVLSKAIVKERRKMLSKRIYDKYNGIVQFGPYKDMKLGNRSNISQGPLALKILGLYEQVVVNKINSIGKFDDFLNFGAADGYMALGPLFNKSCERSICFEMTEKGRAAVEKNASLNSLDKNLVIKGKVDFNVIATLEELNFNPNNSVLLCDIEGAEFDIFTNELLSFLDGMTIIIELHDRLIYGGDSLRSELQKRIPKNANIEIISNKNTINFDGIYDLEILNDNDRAIVMSEGRKFYGEWLVIEHNR